MTNTNPIKHSIKPWGILEPFYHLNKFEKEVQLVFDEVSDIKNMDRVAIKLIKGNMFLKGDYFIPLKGSNIFQLNCDDLLERLKRISCIGSVEVDLKYNLTFCLQRHILYKAGLNEVLKYSSKYGMVELIETSVLVLVDGMEREKDFNSMRNALLGEHIISILACNNVKVYYNDFGFKSRNDFCNAISCTDCGIDDLCKQLEEKVKISNCRTASKHNGKLCDDVIKHMEINSTNSKYSKCVSDIILCKKNVDVQKASYIIHLLKDHLQETPKFIVHIANQGKSCNIYTAGRLLQLLEKYEYNELFIFSQTVQYKSKNNCHSSQISANDFILAHTLEIERAMAHKYDSYNPSAETWSSRVRSLTDTAVKFEFLRFSHNHTLHLNPPCDEKGGKNFGVFVQYNFARLSNIFKNFEDKVKEGYYGALLPLEDVDFSLLKLEEEWNLFHYVLSFPKLVLEILESLLPEEGARGRHRFNRVCLMLQELCQYLSLYYSRIRILTGPQQHLQRTMNARLWLLKGIHQIFKNSFLLLNVTGLDQM